MAWSDGLVGVLVDRTGDVRSSLAGGERKHALANIAKTTAITSKRYLVVHRTSLAYAKPPVEDHAITAVELAMAYASDASLGTGLCVPYHAIVTPHVSEQVLPWESLGAHSWGGYNTPSIAVAIVSKQTAFAEQLSRLVAVVAGIIKLFPHLQITGHHHTRNDGLHLQGSSKDEAKLCPEPVVLMSWLQAEVGKLLVC